MMKTKLYIALLGVALLMSSCDLDEYPYGFYSENNFYKSKDDAESALFYAYNSLTFLEYSRGIFYIAELASETTTVKAGEGYGSQELENWTAGSTNESLQYYFKYCYIAINRANAIIQNVPNSEFSEDDKKAILGEAHFLRAYSYFNLVRTFGVVPIHKEVVKTVAQAKPGLPVGGLDELYDFINSDLRLAESYMPVERKVGRADKVAAQSILAKSYLTIASSKANNVDKYAQMSKDANIMYDSAAYYANKVLLEQTEYGLDQNLVDIYDVEKPDGAEHIFIMSMDRTGKNEGNYSKLGKMFHPYINEGADFYVKNPDGSLVKTCGGWQVFQTTDTFYNSFSPIDKRKTDLLVVNVYNEKGDDAGTSSYPFTRKYVDPKFIGDKSSAKPYLIRFSDIALVYAEAVGPTTDGYKWIGEIRSRAGLPNLPAGMNVADFRKAIVKERGWELAFEGQRLYDLRRTASVVATDPKAVAAGITEAKAAFYAIPQVEIDLNPNVKINN